MELMKKEETQRAEELKSIVAQEQQGLSISTKNADIIKENLTKLNIVAGTIKEALIEGLDYGIIPGVQKPSLFKPGAEKIVLMYGLIQQFTILEESRDPVKNLVVYKFKCNLINSHGKQVAEGYGLCNSHERKYRSQNCYDIENTVMKMAKKRALVDAAISIGVLSQVFTQDVEDMNIIKNGALLPKQDRLTLYANMYNLFVDFLEQFQTKQDYKEHVKNFVDEMILRANVEAKNFMNFTTKDKQVFCDYLEKNTEQEIKLFAESIYKNKWEV